MTAIQASPDRESVHEALEALYDNLELARCRLADCFPQIAEEEAVDARAEAMRSLLLAAVETLRPVRRVPFGSPESRSYDVLTARYVESLTIPRMEEELALGRRQIYRDLEEAEARLAEVLLSWIKAPPLSERLHSASSSPDPLHAELLVLSSDLGRVDVHDLVREAASVVQPLAQQTHVRLTLPAASEPDLVLADRAILKQLLIQLLSYAIQGGAPVTVSIEAAAEATEVCILTRIGSTQERRLTDAERIAASQGMSCITECGSHGMGKIRLLLRHREPTRVLVVEDNPGAVELYRRYLPTRDWQVMSVSDPRQATRAAAELRPDIIVLDIMMPRLDGWSVLQSLHQSPATGSVPIVICSVVENPELGLALGARAYLTKPVSQGQFLATLRHCLAKPRPV